MATLVFLHAHPDDEATGTAGAMAKASAEGHRVVTVYGTNGDHGEVPEDLAPGETLVARRRQEAAASAKALGVHRIAWLDYSDSGMTGWEQNNHDGAFVKADLDEAAGRLAAVLDEENADLLIGYDDHGNYGHPDHVKVHQVAHRAAELAARRPRLLEATMNRDLMRQLYEMAKANGLDEQGFDPDQPMDDGNPMGSPEAIISWQIDASPYLDQRRASLRAHASQITDTGQLLGMPQPIFEMVFGVEHYIEPGAPAGMRQGWFLDEPV